MAVLGSISHSAYPGSKKFRLCLRNDTAWVVSAAAAFATIPLTVILHFLRC